MISSFLSPFANHLWQSTLFVVAIGLLTLAFRKNGAAVRHWLWLAASLKFLLPLSLLMSIGSQFSWKTAPAIGQPRAYAVIEQISQPFTSEAIAIPATNSTPEFSGQSRIPMILLSVWFCGAMVSVIGWMNRWRRIRQALRGAIPLNLDLPIQAVSCLGRLEPGIFGIVRPVLILPDGITDRLTPAQLQAILAHELCHVRRRDNLVAAGHMVVEAIFWFHPLVWWIETRLIEEQEMACDEEVLRQGSDPQTYAEGILKVCEFYLQSPLVCVSGVTGADLKKRIATIMRPRIIQPLAFEKRLLLGVAGMLAIAGPLAAGFLNAPLRAQTTATTGPKFEVVSVKPCASGSLPEGMRGGRLTVSPGRINFACMTALSILNNAYIKWDGGHEHAYFEFRETKVVGGPDWIGSDRFDINAKAEDGASSEAIMLGPMLQALMEDRFKLKIHRETREVPVYVMTVGKSGLKAQPVNDRTCVYVEFAKMPPPLAPGERPCRANIPKKGNVAVASAEAASLDDFARLLSLSSERPIIDKTGIGGLFAFHLEFSLDPNTPGYIPTGEPPSAPSLLTAIQEQLGLKLEAATGPGATLVVDHIEKPKENGTSPGSIQQGASSDGSLQLKSGVPTQAPSPAIAPKSVSFEVASIKPSTPGADGNNWAGDCRGIDSKTNDRSLGLGRCVFRRVTLKSLFSAAYSPVFFGGRLGFPVKQIDQVEGLGWIDSEVFDIDAKAENISTATEEHLYQMLRQLLADRFKLTFHRGSKDIAGFELLVAKNGLKLKESTGREANPGRLGGGPPSGGFMAGQAVPLSAVANFLSHRLDRPVQDKTGVTGLFNWELRWAPDDNEVRPDGVPVPANAGNPGPSLLTAVKEQLGLLLESVKVPVDILSIEHAERPKPN